MLFVPNLRKATFFLEQPGRIPSTSAAFFMFYNYKLQDMKAWITLAVYAVLLIHGGDMASGPDQPEEGWGGRDYAHDEVLMYDFVDGPEGYFLFEPSSPKPDSAHVIVLLHGYSAMNPMVYGGWIRHIVRKGYIVIYPIYQMNLIRPMAKAYVSNAVAGIRQALATLDSEEHVRPIVESLILVGHSYGGAIAANLGVNYADWDIPPPKGLMLVCPGTSPLKRGWLPSYEGMAHDIRLMVVLSIHDPIVGEGLGRFIYETAVNTPTRNLIRLLPDDYGQPPLTSGHTEAHALDAAFDNGRRCLSFYIGLKYAKYNAADYFCYWKLLDAMTDCIYRGEHCEQAFDNTPEQRYMGKWSDGEPVRELEVMVPTSTSAQ